MALNTKTVGEKTIGVYGPAYTIILTRSQIVKSSMNGVRLVYTRTVYGAVYGVVHGVVYGDVYGVVHCSYKKNIYPYTVSIRFVYG